MIEAAASWPVSAWVAILTLLGGALAWPAKALWHWFVRRSDRSDRQEDRAIELVELLRRALDKGRVRENAIASACDMLILALVAALEEIRDPSPVIAEARQRALTHLQSAAEACREIEKAPL